MLFGDDFQYQNALHDFKNIDKLIKYVNAQVHIYKVVEKSLRTKLFL